MSSGTKVRQLAARWLLGVLGKLGFVFWVETFFFRLESRSQLLFRVPGRFTCWHWEASGNTKPQILSTAIARVNTTKANPRAWIAVAKAGSDANGPRITKILDCFLYRSAAIGPWLKSEPWWTMSWQQVNKGAPFSAVRITIKLRKHYEISAKSPPEERCRTLRQEGEGYRLHFHCAPILPIQRPEGSETTIAKLCPPNSRPMISTVGNRLERPLLQLPIRTMIVW